MLSNCGATKARCSELRGVGEQLNVAIKCSTRRGRTKIARDEEDFYSSGCEL